MRSRPVLAAALALALTACGGDGDEPRDDATPATTAPPPTAEPIDPRRRSQEIRTADVLGATDVVTAVEQPRYLEGTPRITVPVRFEGEGRFRVTGIALRTPRFAALPVEETDVLMVPGQRVALQVDLGAPVCDGRPAADPRVHLEVSADEAQPVPVEVPIPPWLVDELNEERCAQAAVAEQATIRFGEPGPLDGPSLRTEVLLERAQGRSAVALTELTGSVILVAEPEAPAAAPPLARLDPGDDVVRLPVTVTAARCDAHAVSGSTKTFVFHAWLQVGDGEPVRLDLRPDPALEGAMQDAIEACIARSVTDPRRD